MKYICHHSKSHGKNRTTKEELAKAGMERKAMGALNEITRALTEGDSAGVEQLCAKALAGNSAMDILDNGLIPGMDIVGRAFEDGDMFLPQVLMAAQAMKAAMRVIGPELKKSGADSRGTIVLGTVQGDQHDIGKNLVSVLMEGAGFTVVDLGCDVPDARFVNAVREHDARLLGMSALLNNTMTRMKGVIEALKKEGLDEKVKVMVGGAPLDEGFADEIGAHAYAADGVEAVRKAVDLLGG